MLTSLFLSFKNILRDKNPDDLAQNEADNCFIISCPLDNKKSPEDSSKERKTVSSGSDGTHSTPGMCLPASCFLTVMGQGDDDPSLPPEQKDGDVLASDICPICQEPLADNTVELTHCCGRLFHAHCLVMHRRHSANGGCCPWCRTTPWLSKLHTAHAGASVISLPAL